MFDDLIKDLQKGLKSFEENKAICMNNIGEEFKTNVQNLTPVDTGKLKKSYTVTTTNDSAELTNKQDYALYVNDGHSTRNGSSFVPGKHMLEQGLSKMPVVITREVDKLIKNTKLL